MLSPAQAEAEFWSNVESKVDAILIEAMEESTDVETPIIVNAPQIRPHHPIPDARMDELQKRYQDVGWRVSKQANGQLVFRRPLPPVVEPVARRRDDRGAGAASMASARAPTKRPKSRKATS